MNIFFTIFLTVISGVLVFIISQIIMEQIIKPLIKFKEIKGRISYCKTMIETLKNYRNSICKDQKLLEEKSKNASDEIKNVAYELAGLLASHEKICKKKKNDEYILEIIQCSNYLFQNILVGNADEIIHKLKQIQDNLTYK